MSKLLIGMPTNGMLSIEFTNSLMQLVASAQKKYGFYIETYFVEGVRTDRNRNEIVQYFLDNGFDYLLFLDTDMVYPADIIEKYIESGKELIGGLYYKRSQIHYPIAYKLEYKDGVPKFIGIEPEPYSGIQKIGGVGTGGMFIKKSVFEKIKATGKDFWFEYGKNYHLPFKTERQATHDVVFCRKAHEAGIDVYLHTDVVMQHIGVELIDNKSWERDKQNLEKGNTEGKKMEYELKDQKDVTIIVPAYGEDSFDQLKNTLQLIENETKYKSYEVKVVIDGDQQLANKIVTEKLKYRNTKFIVSSINQGYGNTVNETIQHSNTPYYVYLADDVLVGKGWLTEAMRCYKEAFKDNDGLLTFNDGKWYGKIACHGLVSKTFIEKYTGSTLFHPGYKHYHVDLELTHVAANNDKLIYASNAVAYHLQGSIGRSKLLKRQAKADSTREADWQLFNQRKQLGFPIH